MSTITKPDLNEMLRYNFVLWIKFKDGNCRSMKAYSVVTTVNQYLYGKGKIKVDYYKGFESLITLVEVTYKDKFSEARIYRKHDNKLLIKWRNGHITEQAEFSPAICTVFYNRKDYEDYNINHYCFLPKVTLADEPRISPTLQV
jgi:hypothetical protein